MKKIKITKKRYIHGFLAVTLLLALVRCVFPGVSDKSLSAKSQIAENDKANEADSLDKDIHAAVERQDFALKPGERSRFFDAGGNPVKHRIISVPSYADAFPDQNDVQLVEAKRWGVEPVIDRADAERRKSELVYVGSNPYFYVDKLNHSVPYLVPRASVLLQDIGRSFYDSLAIKQIPLHKIIVTSVTRSKADVQALRGHNSNATENSCHLYGTTFDVCYNRYKTVQAPGERRREVQNDTLKWVLAEVLRDFRERGRCCVKYEVKQGCWHITVK